MDSFRCSACAVDLTSVEELRAHSKLDWHRHNLKRRLVHKPPITEDEFEVGLCFVWLSPFLLCAVVSHMRGGREGHNYLHCSHLSSLTRCVFCLCVFFYLSPSKYLAPILFQRRNYVLETWEFQSTHAKIALDDMCTWWKRGILYFFFKKKQKVGVKRPIIR